MQLWNITKGNSGPHMTERLPLSSLLLPIFQSVSRKRGFAPNGNLNQCLDYVDLLFSTILYTKTLHTWTTWMLTASLMWIAILSPNLNWRGRITESATTLYVTEHSLPIMSYRNPPWILPSPPSDYVLNVREVKLPTLQPDKRTTLDSNTVL
jgi:hypothetical protein